MNEFKTEPNRYLTDKVASKHFYERLQNLIERSVGFVALRGGMGTVTEISLVWNKLQTGVIEKRPLVLLGRLLAEGGRMLAGKSGGQQGGRGVARFREKCRRSLPHHY
jgi:predicted Rossmann-fold nucleotide-binding protein